MSGLKGFGLENFRVFKEKQWFDFAPITILTGTNSSGKSSLVNAIRAFAKNFSDKETFDSFNITDIEPKLGNFEKLISKNSNSSAISFTLPTLLKGIPDRIMLQMDYSLDTTELKNGKLTGFSMYSKKMGKTVISIKEEGINRYKISINYLYFWEAYKRECKKIKKYKKLESDNYNVLYPEPVIAEIIDGKIILKEQSIEDQVKRENLLKELSLIHPDYYEYNKSEVKNYIPFFEKIEEEDYCEEHKLLLGYYFLNDLRKPKENKETDEEKNQKYSDLLEPYLKNEKEDLLEVIQKEENLLLENFSYYYYFNSNSIYTLGESLKNPSIFIFLDSIRKPDQSLRNGEIGGRYDFIVDRDNKKNLLIKLSELEKHPFYIPAGGYEGNGLSANEFFLHDFLYENIKNCFKYAVKEYKDYEFIGSIRNIVKRSYRNSMDETGFNKLLIKVLTSKNKNEEFVNKYLQLFQIGDRIEIVRDVEGEFSRVYIKDKEKTTLLADLGYGISQVLPILLSIALNIAEKKENRVLFIEEPETNLHPALQSKLADMFVDAMKSFNIHFVIETHSEYLIRKLQYLTAKTDSPVNPDDSVIYYFYHPDKVPVGEKQVKKINIQEDGSLTDDFGNGFFDEAMNLKFELLDIRNFQKN